MEPSFDYKRILRPNPDFDEDLEIHTAVTPEISQRIRSYTDKAKAKKQQKPACKCKDPKPSLGVAPLRKLNDGHHMPSFGLGTWLGYVTSDTRGKEFDVQRAVEWAIDAGYRHIDTAYIYNTELQVGRAIAKKIASGVVKRSDLFITTKLWNDQHARQAVVPALKQSLQKLNLRYVDLYLIHWPVGGFSNGVFDNTDYLETWLGMVEARDQGLASSIGVSNFNQHMMDRIVALSQVTPAVLQVEINLNLQQPQLLKYCRERDITVIGYTPFGSLFYGKAAPEAPPPRIDDPGLMKIARNHNKTVPQIVLRYLMELGVTPVPKSVTKERIEENVAIFDFELSRSERDLLQAYDVNYRTIAVRGWEASPYYPFEKTALKS